jgi:hypothetical protein
VTVRQFYYPRTRPYWSYFGDQGPIQPAVPTLPSWYTGTAQLPGATLPTQTLGAPLVNPLVPNAPLAQPVLQPGAPMPGELEQALMLLSSPRERDRVDGAILLARSKQEKATEPLQRLLASDPSARVREAAAGALGLIGSPAALKALEVAARDDGNRDVRRSAQLAAESIRPNAR